MSLLLKQSAFHQLFRLLRPCVDLLLDSGRAPAKAFFVCVLLCRFQPIELFCVFFFLKFTDSRFATLPFIKYNEATE